MSEDERIELNWREVKLTPEETVSLRIAQILEYLMRYEIEFPQRVKQVFLAREETGVFIELFTGEMFYVGIHSLPAPPAS